jgi:predicted Zn-dependent protease
MNKPILTTFFLAALLLHSGAAHADLPDLGDISQATMTQADEARIGRDAMRALRQDGAISDDPELTRYINDIGGRMAAGVQIPGLSFTFFIVDDQSINAFAMPGGYVGVNKGLILATQSEGELASVLGHEMAHVTQHHIARMQANSTPNELLLLGTLVAAALASRSGNGEAAFGALNAGVGMSIASQLSFSRDYEREADRVGMKYLTAAGYDAREMPAFFQRLQQSERLNGGNAYAFLRTHPVTSERISEAENRADSTPVRMRANSIDYLLVREKIRVQQLAPADALKFYQSALSRKLYLSEGAQWYGLARARMLSNDYAGARQALSTAHKLLGPDPMLFGLDAEIARKAGNWSQALAAYRAGLEKYPDNAPLFDGEIDLLLQTGQRQLALNRIRDRQTLTPNDPALFRLQAQAYADNDMLRYHAALGNALYFEQMYEGALEQYHMASQAKGDDFYLRSSIEARTRELEKKLADDKRDGKDSGGGIMQ